MFPLFNLVDQDVNQTEKGCPRPFIIFGKRKSPSFYYFWKKDVPVLLLFLEKGCPRPFIFTGKRNKKTLNDEDFVLPEC